MTAPIPSTAEYLQTSQPTPDGPSTQQAGPSLHPLEGIGALPVPLPAVPGYELLRELGRGGMGVVFLARQLRPERLVALKMLRDGVVAGAEDLARFQAESQILSQFQHPNIVQVFEVGELEGHPFFAMEYVPGGTLAQHMRRQPFPPRDAAALLRTLALALFAAHEQGIIHRDLKPANVLFMPYDECRMTKENAVATTLDMRHSSFGTLKLTDFGLAKRLDAQGLTQTGAIMGTPEYMAPEQAMGLPQVHGPAVDIYALGALLYELLTGRPPFRGATPVDTVQQVLLEEVVPPSRLVPKIPRDLETICLKCLRKEALHRYHSAQALAEDVQRFLDSRPILARPIGSLEQAVKWARRKPALAGLLGTVGLAVVLLVAAVGLLVRANADEADQRRLAQQNEAQATAARKEAEAKEKQARENYRIAQEAVDKLFGRVLDRDLLKSDLLVEARKLLLRESLPFLRRLLQQQGDDPYVLNSMARNHLRMGLILAETEKAADAQEHFEAAWKLMQQLEATHPELLEFEDPNGNLLNNLGEVYRAMGRLDDAAKYFRLALNRYEKKLAANPEELAFRSGLGAVHNNWARLCEDTGKIAEAAASYRRAIECYETLTKKSPGYADYRSALAGLHTNLARLQLRHGQAAEAVENMDKAGKLFQELEQASEHDLRFRDGRVAFHLVSGDLHIARRNFAAAQASFTEAYRQSLQLAQAYPTVTKYIQLIAGSRSNLATLHMHKSEFAAAEEAYRDAHRRYRELIDNYPNVLEYQLNAGGICNNLSVALRAQKKYDEALEWSVAGEEIFRALLARMPQSDDARQFLSNIHRNRALTYYALRKPLEEAQQLTRAMGLNQDPLRQALQLQRLQALARAGGPTARRALAAGANSREREQLMAYDLARCHALLAEHARNPVKREDQANQTLSILAQLHREGFFADAANRRALQEDVKTAFASLAEHPDMKTLLGKLGPAKPGD